MATLGVKELTKSQVCSAASLRHSHTLSTALFCFTDLLLAGPVHNTYLSAMIMRRILEGTGDY